jgi:hypothetical protein
LIQLAVENQEPFVPKTGLCILLAAIALSACSDGPATIGSTAATASERDRTAAESCATQGGTLQPVGITGRQACVIRYKDAGKTCTDGSQCEGDCWAGPKAYAEDEKVTGTCQPTNMPFGCHSRVTNGRGGPVLCVD